MDDELPKPQTDKSVTSKFGGWLQRLPSKKIEGNRPSPDNPEERLDTEQPEEVSDESSSVNPAIQPFEKLSRADRRRRERERYLQERAQMAQPPTLPIPEPGIRTAVNSQETSQRPKNLPSGFEQVVQMKEGAGHLVFKPTLENMPWLQSWLTEPGSKLEVNLVRITLTGSHEQLLFGSFIKGDVLTKAAQQLDEHRKTIADALLYTHIPEVVRQNYSNHVSVLINQVSDKPIFYFANKGGQRVYFMRFQSGDLPVIIRIAICDKSNQIAVLGELTDESHKRIKYLGKL